MAGLFYSVDLTRDERTARNPRLVEKFLVELCQEHCPDNWQEVDREALAMATALKALKHRYSAEVVGGNIGHKEASRYKGILPGPSGLVAKELRIDDLEGGRALEVDIKGFVCYSHRSAPELKRFTLRIPENRVMLKAEFGSGIPSRLALCLDCLSQGANWAVCAVVRQQRTTHRAGSFGRGCRHRMLLASRILPDSRAVPREKSPGRTTQD